MVMDPTLPRISVRDLMMQAFLTGWAVSYTHLDVYKRQV